MNDPGARRAAAAAAAGLAMALVPLGLAGCGRSGGPAAEPDAVAATRAASATLTASATLQAGAVATDGAGARPTMALVPVTPRPTPTADPGLPAPAHALVVDRDDPDRLYLTFVRGMMHSTDGGMTWSQLRTSKADEGTSLVVAAQLGDGTLFAAGPGAFKRSADGGTTWQPVSTTLGADIRGLAVDPSDGQRLYALVRGAGVASSTDGGARWTAAGGALPSLAYGLWVVAADPTVLVTTDRADGGLLRSDDGGASWAPLPATGARGDWRAIVRGDAGLLFAATGEGLFRSGDGGASWLPLGPFKTLVTIAVAPNDGQVITAITPGQYNVYRSQDGGATWPGSGTRTATAPPSGDATPLPTAGRAP